MYMTSIPKVKYNTFNDLNSLKADFSLTFNFSQEYVKTKILIRALKIVELDDDFLKIRGRNQRKQPRLQHYSKRCL